MSIHQITKILTKVGIEEGEANAIVKLLIEHFCNFRAIDMVFGKKLDESKLSIVQEKAQYIAQTRKPVQQVIGWGYFMGEKFIVTPDTLIPRDETELLVRKVIEIADKNGVLKVLDMCTGSGCIACMVAKKADLQVLGTDISEDALKVALDNTAKHNLYNKAIFRKSNLFSNIQTDEKFDIIVSNPPYIPEKIESTLQPEVLYEPKLALFTKDEKGLEFYEKIISESPQYLNQGGFLIFEAGQNQAELIEALMKSKGFKDVGFEEDLAGIKRVVFAHL